MNCLYCGSPLRENGSELNTSYEMLFEDAGKTVASEPGDIAQTGWKYTLELHDGYLTLKSRYPDKFFYLQ